MLVATTLAPGCLGQQPETNKQESPSPSTIPNAQRLEVVSFLRIYFCSLSTEEAEMRGSKVWVSPQLQGEFEVILGNTRPGL